MASSHYITKVFFAIPSERENQDRRGNEYCKDEEPLCISYLAGDSNFCSSAANQKRCPLTCGVCKVADDCGKNYRMDPEKKTCFGKEVKDKC